MRVPSHTLPTLVLGSVSGVLTGVGLPVVRQLVVSSVSPRMVSLEMLVSCLSVFVYSLVWGRLQSFMVRHYVRLKVGELLLLVPLYSVYLLCWSPRLYFLVELAYYVLISVVLGKAWIAVKAFLFTEAQDRIDFDNSFDFSWSLSSMVGYAVSILFVPTVMSALVMLFVADVLSVVGRLSIFRRRVSYAPSEKYDCGGISAEEWKIITDNWRCKNKMRDETNEKEALKKFYGEYVKKPVKISAVLFDGSTESIIALNSTKFGLDPVRLHIVSDEEKVKGKNDYIVIPTLEGDMKATIGDYIIKGINGEFYPCKPDIFEKTYDFLRGRNNKNNLEERR